MRKKKGNNGDRGPSRSRDSPEVIARKRAERAAKRERLAREAATAAITAALDGGSDIALQASNLYFCLMSVTAVKSFVSGLRSEAEEQG